MPLQGAIVVLYYCWVGVTTNFGGVDVVPLLGAIARCHCSVLMGGRCWVPLQGAIVGCYGWGGIFSLH